MPEPAKISIIVEPVPGTATCPICQQRSSHVHGRYRRTLADLPWQGRAVALVVRARKFRCTRRGCPRRIFAERLPEVPAWARRTGRMAGILHQIGLALGGSAGSHLSQRLAMTVSDDSLLRLVQRRAVPLAQTPRLLGVDDFAWRRGQRYGTILLDLETHKVVDLLPDREGATFAAWLKDHPGVEVVARDRANAYAEGIRVGAPEAIQVADRWHLLRNSTDAFQTVLDRNWPRLRDAAKAVLARAVGALPEPGPKVPTKAELRQRAAQADRVQRFEEVARLAHAGMGLRAIRRETGLSRNTIRRWLHEGRPRDWKKGGRASIIDPFLPYLRKRLGEGCHNATQLWRDIQQQGYPGKVILVRATVARLRNGDPAYAPAPAQPTWRRPSTRQLARMLLGSSKPTGMDAAYVDEVLAGEGEIPAATALARRFSDMVRAKDKAAFPAWLADARGGVLGGFAEGLRRDRAAVEAALSLPWSTGPVEGKITKLKLIKRAMYGRASISLLRHRLIAA